MVQKKFFFFLSFLGGFGVLRNAQEIFLNFFGKKEENEKDDLQMYNKLKGILYKSIMGKLSGVLFEWIIFKVLLKDMLKDIGR